MLKLLRKILILNALFGFLLNAHAVAKESAPQRHKRQPVITSVRIVSQDKKLKSREGRDLILLRVPAIDKNGRIVNPRFRFYIQGNAHGNETLTSEFVIWLATRIANGSSPLSSIPHDLAAFDFVPVVNPDGLKNSSRYNAKGVNLNRNFGTLWGKSRENPGTKSFSEPETQAVAHLISTQKYTAAIDVHGYTNWIVAPSTPKQVGFEQTANKGRYLSWYSQLNKEMQNLGPYKLYTAGSLGDGGAFEDWVYWEKNTLAFCLELASPARYQIKTNPYGRMKKIDRFLAYENFINNMFMHAMVLSSEGVEWSGP